MYTKGKKVENLYRLFLHMYKYILSVMGKYTDLHLSQTYLKEKLVINFDDKDDESNIKKLFFIYFQIWNYISFKSNNITNLKFNYDTII